MYTKLYNLFLDALFPVACMLCGRTDTLLCDECREKLPINPVTVRQPSASLASITICADYTDDRIQQLISSFKFLNIRDLGKSLGAILYQGYTTLQLPQDIVLMPIPLHSRREKKRGFNQSMLLAQELSRRSGSPIDAELKRIRARRPQHTLNRRERLINVKGVYQYQYIAAPASVLLIDDIATTFATLNEVARELKKHGTKTVHALVLAKNDP